MRATVLYAYSPSDPATPDLPELELVPDQPPLRVLKPEHDGWLFCESVDGQQGYVPASYVQLEEETPPIGFNFKSNADDNDSVASGGSFTTVAASRANAPGVLSAQALGARLGGKVAAAKAMPSTEEEPLYEPFGDLKLDENATAEGEYDDLPVLAPDDSISCIGGDERSAAAPARGLRLLPHEDVSPSSSSERLGGVRIVRPQTVDELRYVARSKETLWPGMPAPGDVAIYDEQGCQVEDGNYALLPEGATLTVRRVDADGDGGGGGCGGGGGGRRSSFDGMFPAKKNPIHKIQKMTGIKKRSSSDLPAGDEEEDSPTEPDTEVAPPMFDEAAAPAPAPTPTPAPATDNGGVARPIVDGAGQLLQAAGGLISSVLGLAGGAAAAAGSALADGVAAATAPPPVEEVPRGTSQVLAHLAQQNQRQSLSPATPVTVGSPVGGVSVAASSPAPSSAATTAVPADELQDI